VLKCTALIVALLVAGRAQAEIPKNPTRKQIIDSCIIAKVSVQERVALQQCKSRLDAAELLQSMYQERITALRGMVPHRYSDDAQTFAKQIDLEVKAGELYKEYAPELEAVEALIVTLKAEPAPKAKTRK